MDVLNHREGHFNYVKADTDAWLAEMEAQEAAAGKTGLETQPTDRSADNDPSIFQTVTGLFSKGLDLGIALTRPTAPAAQTNTPPEDEKIMGMPKPVFYGGLAVLGLVATVIVVKKMKK